MTCHFNLYISLIDTVLKNRIRDTPKLNPTRNNNTVMCEGDIVLGIQAQRNIDASKDIFQNGRSATLLVVVLGFQ